MTKRVVKWKGCYVPFDNCLINESLPLLLVDLINNLSIKSPDRGDGVLGFNDLNDCALFFLVS